MIFILKKSWKIDKILLIFCLLSVPVSVALPLAENYLARTVVDLVSINESLMELIWGITGLTVGILLLQFVQNIMNAKIQWRSFGNRFSYMSLCAEKVMQTDYENIESAAGQTKMQKAFNGLMSLDAGAQKIFSQGASMLSSVAGLAVYAGILLRLSVWLVIFLLLMSVGSYILSTRARRWAYKNKDHWITLDRKINYIVRALGNFAVGKDIRLYGMGGWFRALFMKNTSERKDWKKREEIRYGQADLFAAVAALIRDSIAYAFLIMLALRGTITASDFVFYFALISQFSGWLFGFMEGLNALQTTALEFADVREFLDMPDHKRGMLRAAELPKKEIEVECEDLSFCYPSEDSQILHHITLKIRKGEKIALVGENGAGKTTLVKLLCGLYTPTSGEIRIRGVNQREINREEYFRLFSVVFQEINLLPVSLAKNIALCEPPKMDYKLLERVLSLSGLEEKARDLPDKENTLLMKSLYENAVELSGGEQQKLALARALYKGGEILILDEPTAALDPISEHRLYLKYGKLTKGKTTIFISHRLASTRFCDRIYYMENGSVVEEGTHEDLMKFGGKYAKMYELQSQCYGEEENHETAV